MTFAASRARSRVLPATGRLLISTDLHGNWEDWSRLRALFDESRARGEDTHWALLGDLVHGPDEHAAREMPELHGFEDRSADVVDAAAQLVEQNPERVHFVLGNHDAGHVGGTHTTKFHPDEVAALEARLSPLQRERLDRLFRHAMLALVAPCGVFLSHGSPGDALTSLSQLDRPFPPMSTGINETLWSYGQRGDVTDRLLARISAETRLSLKLVLHGHDRDESGWFTEGGNQAQAVIFGALPENKRIIWLDLAARYQTLGDLREGIEVQCLHPRSLAILRGDH